MFLIKKFSNKYGKTTINSTKNNKVLNFNNDLKKNFLFNINLNNIKKYNNFLLVGLNLRMENPILNIHLKTLKDNKLIKVFNIGSSFNYNYINYNLGNGTNELKLFFEGRSLLNNIFKNKKNIIIFGQSFITQNFFFFNNFFNGDLKNITIKILNNNNTETGVCDLNVNYNINKINDVSFKDNNLIKNNLIYLINNDSIFFNLLNYKFLIYQGHHNFKFSFGVKKNIKESKKNFLMLPTLTFFEKSGIFINFLGVYQKSKLILLSSINVRND
jgi:NADH dehydrogenase/NADH:ubiquinone oxidoreductase subunit G